MHPTGPWLGCPKIIERSEFTQDHAVKRDLQKRSVDDLCEFRGLFERNFTGILFVERETVSLNDFGLSKKKFIMRTKNLFKN